MPEGKKGNGLSLERLAGFLEVPAPSIANVTHTELEGHTQVRIENSGGILSYAPEEIRIRSGRLTMQFQGRNLTIKSLSAELLEIRGFLTGIRFIP